MFLALAAGTGTSSSLAPIITAMGDIVDVMGEVWEVMVSNPLLLAFLAASLLASGITLFRKIKRAAKG